MLAILPQFNPQNCQPVKYGKMCHTEQQQAAPKATGLLARKKILTLNGLTFYLFNQLQIYTTTIYFLFIFNLFYKHLHIILFLLFFVVIFFFGFLGIVEDDLASSFAPLSDYDLFSFLGVLDVVVNNAGIL